VRRADRRTPEQVVIQQLTNQLGLPDRDLCQMHRRCGALPPAPDEKFWWCAWAYLAEDGSGRVVECPNRAEWRLTVPGLGCRNGCTSCVAQAIRAHLYLNRERYRRGGQKP
jgi:hypothetical protein